MGASAAGISIIARGGGTRADMLIETMLHPLATQTTGCGTPLFGGGGSNCRCGRTIDVGVRSLSVYSAVTRPFVAISGKLPHVQYYSVIFGGD